MTEPVNKPVDKPVTDELLCLSQVLLEEFRLIHGRDNDLEETLESLPLPIVDHSDLTDGQIKAEQVKENERLTIIYDAIHKLTEKQTALCLSGGGIRSATFCLGILQGLTHFNLLDKFDYLSTVSGGGYIGSWLTAWMSNKGPAIALEELRTNAERDFGSETKSEKAPKKPASRSIFEPEPREIAHLRSFSNYLSPKMGLLSADTWTLVAIYLRNLVLNWLVLIPLLICVLSIPRIYVSLIAANFGYGRLAGIFGWTEIPPALKQEYLYIISIVFLGAGLVLGAMALAYIGSHRPSLRTKAKESDANKEVGKPEADKKTEKSKVNEESKKEDGDSPGRFLRFFILPLLSSVILLTIGRAWFLYDHSKYLTLGGFIGIGVGLLSLGWLFTFAEVRFFFGKKIFSDFMGSPLIRVLELITVLVTGVIGGTCLWLLSIPEKLHQWFPDVSPALYACFDGPQLMFVFLLMGIISIGVGSRHINDEDREWWARSGAWVLIIIVIWFVVNVLVLYGPGLLSDTSEAAIKIVTPVLGVIAAIVTIISAISSKTPANNRQAEKFGKKTIIFNFAVKFFAPLSALFLIIVLSLFTSWLIVLIDYVPNIYNRSFYEWARFPDINHIEGLRETSFLFLAGLAFVMFVVSCVMSFCININQFSLHSMYRNRLVRAYLGASNPKREPNPFTGFDPQDNLRMSDLWPRNAQKSDDEPVKMHKLFHVINMTWNLVNGKNLAWQNRKATTFTVSPLHAGNYFHGYRHSEVYGMEKKFGSISLGTAMTISGAAASPNMGYYSSTAVAFLMTLFNARLGWWLGNPTMETYKYPGPQFALTPMIDEALGQTEEDQKYIYLSDGGHFENLGLYEMVLRRCRCIVVVDASRDPDRKFENLGNAIRRIRVDLGIDIRIKDIVNYSKKENEPLTYCALGDILYSDIDDIDKEENGFLIYIKPALIGEVPTDVFNYAKDNLEFPHESIRDQWFSEQQFESYRALGFYAIEQIFDKWSPPDTKKFDQELKEYIGNYIKGAHGAQKKAEPTSEEARFLKRLIRTLQKLSQ